jgi:hypothetical protein
MDGDFHDLPDDVEALRAALITERGRRLVAEADAAAAKAKASSDEALIAHLKLQIEKLRREHFGSRSERTARLIDQMELQLEELEASASEDDLAAERAAARVGTTQVSGFVRKHPARTLSRSFAARTRRGSIVIRLRLLRRLAAGQARRGRH